MLKITAPLEQISALVGTGLTDHFLVAQLTKMPYCFTVYGLTTPLPLFRTVSLPHEPHCLILTLSYCHKLSFCTACNHLVLPTLSRCLEVQPHHPLHVQLYLWGIPRNFMLGILSNLTVFAMWRFIEFLWLYWQFLKYLYILLITYLGSFLGFRFFSINGLLYLTFINTFQEFFKYI